MIHSKNNTTKIFIFKRLKNETLIQCSHEIYWQLIKILRVELRLDTIKQKEYIRL